MLTPCAHALDARVVAQLKRLNPVDQLEQRCDIEGMERLSADKVISYTFSRPTRSPVRLQADGAVFRRKGEWYRLSYDCVTRPDNLTITSFKFHVGSKIPREEWSKLSLYP